MENSQLRSEIEKIVLALKKENNDKLIPIEASGRHVHLSQEDVEKLFGSGYKLTKKRELSQPGQFLAEEKVKLIGPKNVIYNTAILAPARESTQVELSKTDLISLGINAPLRLSGNIDDSSSIFIASDSGVLKISEGVIIAKRHIHMTPKDAERLNVKEGEIVNVEALTKRPIIFKDVLIRINNNFHLNMHLDYDEANACLLNKGDQGKIIKTGKMSND